MNTIEEDVELIINKSKEKIVTKKKIFNLDRNKIETGEKKVSLDSFSLEPFKE